MTKHNDLKLILKNTKTNTEININILQKLCRSITKKNKNDKNSR